MMYVLPYFLFITYTFSLLSPFSSNNGTEGKRAGLVINLLHKLISIGSREVITETLKFEVRTHGWCWWALFVLD